VFVKTLLHWKSEEYYSNCVHICSLRYTVCNAHAPYCHLWPAPLYNIFPHYLINGTIFEKPLLKTKCLFWFSLQLMSETFFILRRNERDTIKCVYWSSCTYPLFMSGFNETWLFSTKFWKILKNQIPWNSVQWEVSCSMRTDGQTWRSW